MTQRTRWSQGNIQCVKYMPQIVRSTALLLRRRRRGRVLPALPFIQLAGIVIWPAVFVAVCQKMAAATQGHYGTVFDFWWFFALVFILGIAPFGVWGRYTARSVSPARRGGRARSRGIGLWIYVYYMYLAAIRAAGQLLLGRTGWVKTQRNAEPIENHRSRKAMSDGGSS